MCSPVSITDAARERMRSLLQSSNQGSICLSVTSKGCGGHGYKLDFGGEGETVDLGDGYRLMLDSKSVLWLVGTEIDYRQTGFGGEFVFHNPQAAGTCGCGKSFTCG